MAIITFDALDQIPFDRLQVSQKYLVKSHEPDALEQLKARVNASPVAFNRRPYVHEAPGMPGHFAFVVLPANRKDAEHIQQELRKLPPGRPGRPIGKLGMALELMQQGETIIAARDGRLSQTIRNTATRVGARMKRTYRVESMKRGDPRMEWTQDMLEVYDDGDFFAITRTA